MWVELNPDSEPVESTLDSLYALARKNNSNESVNKNKKTYIKQMKGKEKNFNLFAFHN